ncbi:hypothetical protein OnM2_103018 [Erysiphe neolycopersici]|uniref:VPS4-associated protein 1 n=1 Tax=Erysiphe neolycopersici TaxID=212602 RepID=A0A420H855_9PEZI|nr:hypothetical protein OnM2_103018 [Erysiphe neolycopersici]
MASFPNIYTHRKVAETAAKSCEICCKPSTSVLLASGHKDFFYVCTVHLKDKNFCKPLNSNVTAAAAAQKKRDLEDEITRLKKEYNDQKRNKKLPKDEALDLKEKNKEKADVKAIPDESIDKKKEHSPTTSISNDPKEFSLTNIFYQQRIEKKKNAEIAKQRNERLLNPNLFPQVPKNLT